MRRKYLLWERKLIDRFADVDPQSRRRWAFRLLAGSAVFGHVNVAAFWPFKVISHQTMDLITNYLSWMALVVGLAELLATTDVRVEQEDD